MPPVEITWDVLLNFSLTCFHSITRLGGHGFAHEWTMGSRFVADKKPPHQKRKIAFLVSLRPVAACANYLERTRETIATFRNGLKTYLFFKLHFHLKSSAALMVTFARPCS